MRLACSKISSMMWRILPDGFRGRESRFCGFHAGLARCCAPGEKGKLIELRVKEENGICRVEIPFSLYIHFFISSVSFRARFRSWLRIWG